ncbi:MAG: thiamine-phosphate kinase [Pseudomonadota bacterium]|nr:thiamine-phosphate kinase [Pseudomonadota bacterium]
MPLASRQLGGSLVLGPGDDCAIQRLPSGQDLVFSIDTLVDGVHFPPYFHPDYLGGRSRGVAARDLAAMGAKPECFTLALTLPEANEDWLEGFARGLAEAAQAFGLALAGGDTTAGPLTLTLQVHGTVSRGRAICRNGARPGDLVAVSGTLGDAGAALAYLSEAEPSADAVAVLERYHRPQPRLQLGVAAAPFASAGIDISDGLLADLDHILEASGCGARLESGSLPLSPALVRLAGARAQDLALRSGDDYELCLTFPPERWKSAPEALRQQLTVIGTIEEDPGLYLDGTDCGPSGPNAGFDHFRRRQ